MGSVGVSRECLFYDIDLNALFSFLNHLHLQFINIYIYVHLYLCCNIANILLVY